MRDHPRFVFFSPLDDEQFVRISANGTRPHRAYEPTGRRLDPHIERTFSHPRF